MKYGRSWHIPGYFMANQTRWSGWFFHPGFIEISLFLSKGEVLTIQSVFFSPIIKLFLQYSHKRSLSWSWNLTHTGFDVQYFIPNSLITSFLRSLCSTFVLWKVGGTCDSRKRHIQILLAFRKSPRFSLTWS